MHGLEYRKILKAEGLTPVRTLLFLFYREHILDGECQMFRKF